MKFYIRLFHGRRTPAQELEDWGTDGPFVGPFDGMGWTYGELKLFFGDDDFEFLFKKQHQDLIHHEGIFYGDFEVIDADWDLSNEKHAGKLTAVSPEKFFNR